MHSASGQNGRIILVVLVTIFTLSAFWFIALGETGLELRVVGGKKSAAQQFFDAEAGLNVAMENFGTMAASLGNDLTTAVVNQTVKDPTSAVDPADQRIVAEISLRPIQSDAGVATSHGQPAQNHESTPPAGSSSGVNTTVTKRYSVNATSGSRELQVGVYRIVPK